MEVNNENILSRKQVWNIVSKDVGSYNFEIKKYEVKGIGENPMGFLGEHRKLEVDVILKNKEELKKKLIFFVKKTPNGVASHREYLEKLGCFFKEIGLYKNIFSEFNKVLPESVIKWRPNYYYSMDDDLFVIEDLSVSEYYMYPERTLMDKEHVIASLKSLAAMHASSIILEERLKEGKVKVEGRMQKDVRNLWDVYHDLLFENEAPNIVGHPGHTSREVAIKAELEIIDHLDNYTEDEKTKIKKELPNRMRRLYQFVKSSDRFKNVIVHGDIWANNILFKKNKEGKIQNAVLIDFQLVRYAPPAHDFITFLHLVQNRAFRKENQYELMRIYYHHLSKLLLLKDLNPNELLPWKEFVESCEYYEEYGVITCLFFFQLILAPNEISSRFLSSPDIFFNNMLVDRGGMVLECFLSDEVYRERTIEALNELIEKFILI